MMERWPALPYDAWKDTYATLHMWTQVVGKVAVALAQPVNHSWGIAFHLTGRGFRTGVLPHGDRSFSIAFDFIDHRIVIETSDGLPNTGGPAGFLLPLGAVLVLVGAGLVMVRRPHSA